MSEYVYQRSGAPLVSWKHQSGRAPRSSAMVRELGAVYQDLGSNYPPINSPVRQDLAGAKYPPINSPVRQDLGGYPPINSPVTSSMSGFWSGTSYTNKASGAGFGAVYQDLGSLGAMPLPAPGAPEPIGCDCHAKSAIGDVSSFVSDNAMYIAAGAALWFLLKKKRK